MTCSELAMDLRSIGRKTTVAEVRGWPPWKRRAAFLWSRIDPQIAPPFDGYIEERSKLRSCRICGCTEDFACADPGMGCTCSWVGPDLCSACGRRSSAVESRA